MWLMTILYLTGCYALGLSLILWFWRQSARYRADQAADRADTRAAAPTDHRHAA